MNDADLDDLVLSAARVSNDEVEEFGLVGDRDALSLAIVERRKLPMAGPLSSVLRAGSAIGVVLALLAAVAVTVRSPGGGGSSPAYAQELVALAESNPRLLIDAPGWEVISVHEASPSSGMIHFSNGVRELNLSWAVDPRPEPSSPPAFERRLAVGDGPLFGFEVGGLPAEIYQYPPITREMCELAGNSDCEHFEEPKQSSFVAWWEDGEYSLQAAGAYPSRGDFQESLALLVTVDVEVWLEAMPDSVVIPSDRLATATEMLDDIPLPPGFDPDPILSSDLLETRSQFGAGIVSSIACAWTEIWIGATDQGNDALADQAVIAMGTIRGWSTFRDMERNGDPQAATFAGYAEAMAGGEVVVGHNVMDGPTVVRAHYRDALRCESDEDANFSPFPYPGLGPVPEFPPAPALGPPPVAGSGS